MTLSSGELSGSSSSDCIVSTGLEMECTMIFHSFLSLICAPTLWKGNARLSVRQHLGMFEIAERRHIFMESTVSVNARMCYPYRLLSNADHFLLLSTSDLLSPSRYSLGVMMIIY